jgi:hypothetical protein
MHYFIKELITFIILILCILIISCNKTGGALVGGDYSSQRIVLGQNEKPEIVAAAIDIAGALRITKSVLDTDYPKGTDAAKIPDLIIIGTYQKGKFSNSFLSSYLSGNEFSADGEAIILTSPFNSIRYTVIAGNTIESTINALNMLKQNGLDRSYSEELNWGFTRVRSIVPHCYDQIRNADEIDVDCGGSCASCIDTLIQAIRTLPSDVKTWTLFTVTVQLDLDENNEDIVALEENLPAGCTFQGSNLKSLDATTPTWIFDDFPLPFPTNPKVDTTLSYGVLCETSGLKLFSGQVSTKDRSIMIKGHSSIII